MSKIGKGSLVVFLSFCWSEILYAEEFWSTTCQDEVCTVSGFAEANKVENLIVGMIFAPTTGSDQQGISMRVLAPSEISEGRGIFLDLDGEEVGKAELSGCTAVGCYADVIVTSLDVLAFGAASSLGVSVWNAYDQGYRLSIPTKGLYSQIRKIDRSKSRGEMLLSALESESPMISTEGWYYLPNKLCGDRGAVKLSLSIQDPKALGSYFNHLSTPAYLSGSLPEQVINQKWVTQEWTDYAEKAMDAATVTAKRVDLKKVDLNVNGRKLNRITLCEELILDFSAQSLPMNNYLGEIGARYFDISGGNSWNVTNVHLSDSSFQSTDVDPAFGYSAALLVNELVQRAALEMYGVEVSPISSPEPY